MNSVITRFYFDGAQVRVITRDAAPWWVLADVCRVLEISNPSDAARRLDDDEKTTLDTVEGGIINGLGVVGAMPTIINESGLYSLILSSRKPQAKRFRKWVTAEVMPAIRKTGSYSTASAIDPMAVLNDPAVMRGLSSRTSAGPSASGTQRSAHRTLDRAAEAPEPSTHVPAASAERSVAQRSWRAARVGFAGRLRVVTMVMGVTYGAGVAEASRRMRAPGCESDSKQRACGACWLSRDWALIHVNVSW